MAVLVDPEDAQRIILEALLRQGRKQGDMDKLKETVPDGPAGEKPGGQN